MKKISLFLVVLFVFSACEDLKNNDRFLQVSVDETFLRTDNPTAVLHTDGSLTISGSYQEQVLTLKVNSQNAGTYYFGINNTDVAHYKIEQENTILEYSTIEGMENQELEANLGQLDIYPVTHIKASRNPKTISGEFRFRGKLLNRKEDDSINQPNIFFHQGFFYNLPVQNQE